MLGVAVALTLAFGAGTALLLAQGQGAAGSLATQDGPTSINLARVRAALADADRVAAASFLSGGAVHLGGAGSTYQDDIKVATGELAGIAAAGPAGPGGAEQIQAIEALIVVYMGLVDQAHANADHGVLGLTYLAYASDLMHDPDTGILPRVTALTEGAAAQAADRRSDRWLSVGAIVLQIAGGVLVVAVLVAVQVYLARRFRRMLNPALAAATVLGLVLLIVATRQAVDTRDRVRDGVGALRGATASWSARAALADAHAARVRSLIVPPDAARALPPAGTGGAVDSLRDAGGLGVGRGLGLAPVLEGGATAGERADVAAAQAAYRQFARVDGEVATRAGDGHLDAAVTLALGSGPAGLTGSFRTVDGALNDTADSTQHRFDTAMRAARSTNGLGLAVPVATLVVALLVAGGLLLRLKEYRR